MNAPEFLRQRVDLLRLFSDELLKNLVDGGAVAPAFVTP
jgi:hypothetical protein